MLGRMKNGINIFALSINKKLFIKLLYLNFPRNKTILFRLLSNRPSERSFYIALFLGAMWKNI